MALMDICTCMVILKGDGKTIVSKGRTNPVSFPEVEMLRYLHGDNSVNSIVVIRSVEAPKRDELLMGLVEKYGDKAVSEVYPGKRPQFPMKAESTIPRSSESRSALAEEAARIDPPEEASGKKSSGRPKRLKDAPLAGAFPD